MFGITINFTIEKVIYPEESYLLYNLVIFTIFLLDLTGIQTDLSQLIVIFKQHPSDYYCHLLYNE